MNGNGRRGKFSVVIPTVGRSSLTRSILSIKQNGGAEIVVVHQCSFIELPEQVRDDESIIFVQNTSFGAASGRNLGVKTASNDWILFMDDDDYFLPKAFSRIERAITRFPTTQVFSFQAFCLYNRVIKLKYVGTWSSILTLNDIFKLSWREVKHGFFMPGIVVSRQLALGVPFPEFMKVKEDLTWLIQLQEKGVDVQVVNEPNCVVSKDLIRSYREEDFKSYWAFASQLWKFNHALSVKFAFGIGLRVQILGRAMRIANIFLIKARYLEKKEDL